MGLVSLSGTHSVVLPSCLNLIQAARVPPNIVMGRRITVGVRGDHHAGSLRQPAGPSDHREGSADEEERALARKAWSVPSLCGSELRRIVPEWEVRRCPKRLLAQFGLVQSDQNFVSGNETVTDLLTASSNIFSH